MKVRLLAKHYVRPGSEVGSEHDVDDHLARRLIERGVAEEVKAKPAKSDTPDDSWTVAELRAYAGEHEIDLGDATKKADILVAIHAPPEGEGDGQGDPPDPDDA